MRRSILFTLAALVVVVLAVYYQNAGETRTVPVDGQAMVDVTVPALNAEAQDGEVLFGENCASCHGNNAAGQEGVAPPLVHKIYEPNHHADGAFLLAVSRGVRAHHWPFGDMPPVEGLTRRDVAQIVIYVRTLQTANGIQ